MLELILLLGVLVVLTLLAVFINAPLEELANPAQPPNPAKAPWYFPGLRELVSYSAFVGGVLTPAHARAREQRRDGRGWRAPRAPRCTSRCAVTTATR